MIEMKLQPEFYNYFLNRTKKIEIRLNDEKRRSIKIGDKIKLLKEPDLDEFFIGEVIGLLNYKDFDSLIDDIDIELLADKNYTKEKLIRELEKFYSKEKQMKYGVLGIRIKY